MVFDERIVTIGLHYPRGSKLVSQVEAYLPERSRIVLTAEDSVSATDTLEVAQAGDYQIDGEFKGVANIGAWLGRLKAAPVRFTVKSSPKDEQLFRAKFDRLLAKFRTEFSANPDWDGLNDTLQTDMAAMDPGVAPYIIQVLKGAKDVRFRRLLYRPLVSVGSPDALPFFEECLTRGTDDQNRMACDGLYQLYCRGEGADQALRTLLSGMNNDDVRVRRLVGERLVRIRDPRVTRRLEAAVEDSDETIRTLAARYLAAAEMLDLDEWLELAARAPTRPRYLAARSVIADLETTWNTTRGDPPEAPWQQASTAPETLEQFRKVVRAWRAWARQNKGFSSRFFNIDRKYWPESAGRPESRSGEPAAT